MIGYVLLGFAVFAVMTYGIEALDDYTGLELPRWVYVLLRWILGVGLAIIWGGWSNWYFGPAVVGVSRITLKLDTYLTVLIESISRQRR